METTSARELGGPRAAVIPEPAIANADDLETAQRWDRRVDTAIVVILAMASLLAAWAGYQAGLWSGEKTSAIILAESKLIDGTRANSIGYQVMQIDIDLFSNWLNAFKSENTELATFYEERFTPQLQHAFDAWMATDPLETPDAVSDPFRMPEYKVPELLAAAAFDEEAAPAFADGERAGATSDAYVLTTLLLAVVLFFGGVATKIGWRPAQVALLAVAVLLLVLSVLKLGALPDGSALALSPLW